MMFIGIALRSDKAAGVVVNQTRSLPTEYPIDSPMHNMGGTPACQEGVLNTRVASENFVKINS